MKIRYMLPATLGAMLMCAPVAFAQQHDLGTMYQRDAGVAEFSVTNMGAVTIAKLQNPAIYRVCTHHGGSSVTIIHDKNETKLMGGHCVDVEGSVISLKGDENSPAIGTFQMLHLGQHHD